MIGGIENKVFNLVLFAVLSIVLVYGVVIYFQSRQLTELINATSEKQQEDLQQVADDTMRGVLEHSMGQSAQMEAYIADGLFRQVADSVGMIVDYAQKLYGGPEQYPRIPVAEPDPWMEGSAVAQVLYADGVDAASEEIADEVRLLGNLSEMMLSMYQNTEALGSCFISTCSGITLMVDRHSGFKVANGSILRVNAYERPWYQGAAACGGLYFTGVEEDLFSGTSGVVCAQPVYKDGQLVAVAGVDLFLEDMETAVQGSENGSGFVFIVDQNGHVIFSPKQDGLFAAKQSAEAGDLRENASEQLGTVIRASLSGLTAVQEVECEEGSFYMSGARIETVGWAVVNVVEKAATQAPAEVLKQGYRNNQAVAAEALNGGLKTAKQVIFLILAVACLVALASALFLAKRIVHPLNHMARRMAEISAENPAFEMEKIYRTGDEVEALAESVAELSLRTREFIRENSRITAEKERINTELNVATQIQADMLPSIFPAFPEREEFDLYAQMRPARQVGGDFYDFFLLDEDHLVMVMADVSGKGVPAALFMVITKTLIKNRALQGGSPGQILTDVNQELCLNNEASLFVTVWLAILTISTGEMQVSNAGHEHPAVRRAGGVFELVAYKHSPPLAVMEWIPFEEHVFVLYPGDTLLVYTDGVTEASDAADNLFGEGRLIHTLNSFAAVYPQDVVRSLSKGISAFTAGAEQFDDITMLCLQYYGSQQWDM